MNVGFIVEGSHDELNLLAVFKQYFPEVTPHFAVTNGTKYNNRTKMNVQALMQHTDHIFYLLDSDVSGEMIYEQLSEDFNFPRIRLDAEQCKCQRGSRTKIGVEHAKQEYLAEVLQPVLADLAKTDRVIRKMVKFGETYGARLNNLAQALYSK